jgi:hypothetical protein
MKSLVRPLNTLFCPKDVKFRTAGFVVLSCRVPIKENVRNSYILSINDKVQKSRVINSVRLQHNVRLFSSIKCFFYIGD